LAAVEIADQRSGDGLWLCKYLYKTLQVMSGRALAKQKPIRIESIVKDLGNQKNGDPIQH
jgi:hypothetical protein